MAEASVTVTVSKTLVLPGEGFIALGSLAIDADPDEYATGGIALGATEFLGKLPLAQGVKPTQLYAKGIAGYHYEYDQSNGLLLIRQSAAAGSPEGELSAAAIPAGVSGDTITFFAFFNKFENA